jgi:subtilisin-like proprotein convertase family protein
MPSSREWDGSDSGLIIRDISERGQEMSFFTGNAPVNPDADTVIKELFPDLFIPDKNPEGVKSSMNLTGKGKIKAIRVTVDISHTFKGDIRIELNAPDGTNILLVQSDRQPGNNLNETYDSDTHEELKKLVSAPFSGEWILHIKDLLERDTGSLTHWKIEIDYLADNKELKKERKPALDIPDDDPLGVTDTIQIKEEGVLSDIEVALDVSHTFIRDLRIELTAPSGHSVFLHNRQGGGADDIKQSYNRTNLVELDELLRLPIKGTWSLKLKDLERDDAGTLNSWSLKLKYN